MASRGVGQDDTEDGRGQRAERAGVEGRRLPSWPRHGLTEREVWHFSEDDPRSVVQLPFAWGGDVRSMAGYSKGGPPPAPCRREPLRDAAAVETAAAAIVANSPHVHPARARSKQPGWVLRDVPRDVRCPMKETFPIASAHSGPTPRSTSRNHTARPSVSMITRHATTTIRSSEMEEQREYESL